MFKKFKNDEGGNVAIIFSVLILVLLAGVGVAVDMSQLLSNRQKAADIADSTALAAALVARESEADRNKKTKAHFAGNVALDMGLDFRDDVDITFDDTAKEVTVNVSVKTNYFLMDIFGHEENDVTASSTAGYALDVVRPFSIAFAFDTSGSMGGQTSDGQVKLQALQNATEDLFGAMLTASEEPSLLTSALSTSFSTYNIDIIIQDPNRTGYQHIIDTMNNDTQFRAAGNTNSTPSIQFALDQLALNDASEADPNWSGHIVFMSDGDNDTEDESGNPIDPDVDTIALCDEAKLRGYKIYTVAFALNPSKPNARNLLENCASSPGTFFESSDAEALQTNFETIGKQLGEVTVRLLR